MRAIKTLQLVLLFGTIFGGAFGLVACGGNGSSSSPDVTNGSSGNTGGNGNGGSNGNNNPPAAPAATTDTFELFSGGRGAPLAIGVLLLNDTVDPNATITQLNFAPNSDLGGDLLLDTQGSTDLNDHIIRYTPPDATTAGADGFTYVITDSNGNSSLTNVTLNLVAPEACDAEIPKRKLSGLGWCMETYFDSFDRTDINDSTTGTDIAIQVFFPHPYHQRLNALASGASLAPTESGYSPLLIHSHGFGGNKREDLQDPETFLDLQVAKAAWEDGYNVISYTQRGFGAGDNQMSGDEIGILAPNLEGFDFIRLVDWAMCHFRVDAPKEMATPAENHEVEANNCNDMTAGNSWGVSLMAADDGSRVDDFDDDVALSTVGYSYGGGFQFMAQSVDERVDAIIPMGTWHDLRNALHPNDTPKYFWIHLLNSFATTGGNGQPLPAVIPSALTETTTANSDPNPTTGDAPHNKGRQVSVGNARILSGKGAVAFCNGHQTYYTTKYGDGDGDPESLTAANAANTPQHLNVNMRTPRANLFMIQGYGDTLFNYNEGYDNARCFEDAGGLDVRLLQQTSGHPFPSDPQLNQAFPGGFAIPPHYAGSNASMYLDEVVHCGVDNSGNPVRYSMVETVMQWMNFHTRNGLLPSNMNSSADIFPNACIVQTNVNPDLTLDENDPFYSGTNDPQTGFKWSREGAVFNSVANTPVGHNQYLDANNNPMPNFTFNNTLITGLVNATASIASGGVQLPVPLYTASRPEGEVLSGIPLVHLEITRASATVDEIFYAGIYVKRCQLNPEDTVLDSSNVPTNCDSSNLPELLHFQVSPIRIFPTAVADVAATQITTQADFPRVDPRNFTADGSTRGTFYPLINGDNPVDMRTADNTAIDFNSTLANPQGRLIGVSARLYPGDEVGLALMAGQAAFLDVASFLNSTSAPSPGQVGINGSVQLPLVNTNALTDAPSNVPSYVIDATP